MTDRYNIGIDIGSTTLKVVVLDASGQVVHKVYRRHKTDFNETLLQELIRCDPSSKGRIHPVHHRVTGSAGWAWPSARVSVRAGGDLLHPGGSGAPQRCRALIDLGGEDAKIVFFDEGGNPIMRTGAAPGNRFVYRPDGRPDEHLAGAAGR